MDTSTGVPAGTVVVGVDGSPSATQALDWAIEQATLERRPLTVAHALGGPGQTVWLDQAGVDHQVGVQALREDGEVLIAEAVARAHERAPGLELYRVHRVADPRVTLLDLAQEAAMVVLGSHGRGPLKRLLLGSVSVALSRHAACPVVVLRPHHEGLDRRGILVGVDATPQSLPTLEFAYRQASRRQQPLTVLHCFWDVRSVGTAGNGAVMVAASGPEIEEERLALAESVSGMGEKFPDVNVHTELARGMAEDALIRGARDKELVVVGRHAEHKVAGTLYGTVATAVVEHAEAIVAVVPGRPAMNGAPGPVVE